MIIHGYCLTAFRDRTTIHTLTKWPVQICILTVPLGMMIPCFSYYIVIL